MVQRLSKGQVLAGKVVGQGVIGSTGIAGTVTTAVSGTNISGSGTYLLSNSTSDLTTVYQLATPSVGDELGLIVSTFTTSTAGANVKVKAQSGASFKAATDQDVLVFDAADEAVRIHAVTTTRWAILANVGSVTSSSST